MARRKRRSWPIAVGERFGLLVVDGPPVVTRLVAWHPVTCDCGTGLYARHDRLLARLTVRCRECDLIEAEAKKHLPKRLAAKVRSAISRCEDPRHRDGDRYGRRGIRVHAEWVSWPSRFVMHLMTLDGCDDRTKSMDRIDNDRGYEPGNLRFATAGEQRGNQKRSARTIL